jgi:hypothetical protein
MCFLSVAFMVPGVAESGTNLDGIEQVPFTIFGVVLALMPIVLLAMLVGFIVMIVPKARDYIGGWF